MSSEVELVMTIWENIRDHVPHAKRSEIASDLISAFAGYGFDAADLATIVDEDPDLAQAYEEVFSEDEDDDEIIEEE
jgi:hypothetical protein